MDRKEWTAPSTLFFLLFSVSGFLILLWSASDWFLLMGGLRQESSFCSVNSYWNCDRATLSEFGSFLSLPVGFFGALWFLVFGLGVLCTSSNHGWAKILRRFGILLGLAAILFLGYSLIFRLQTGCTICFAGYICLVGAIIASEKMANYKGALINGSIRYVLFSISVLAMLAFGISNRHRLNTMIPEGEFKAFYQSLPQAVVRPVSTMFRGNPSATITVAEFSDFGCPYCAMASETMLPYLELQKDVKVVFYPYPLDGSCNPNVPRTVHPRSCEWSKAVICAEAQGMASEVHDRVFKMSKELGELPILSETIGSFGLDLGAFNQCMVDSKTDDHLRELIEVATELKVSSTPTFFVNGKTIKGIVPIQLLSRILDEVRKEVGR